MLQTQQQHSSVHIFALIHGCCASFFPNSRVQGLCHVGERTARQSIFKKCHIILPLHTMLNWSFSTWSTTGICYDYTWHFTNSKPLPVDFWTVNLPTVNGGKFSLRIRFWGQILKKFHWISTFSKENSKQNLKFW